MTHKMYKGEMRTFTICSSASYLSASSPSHSTKLTLYISSISLSVHGRNTSHKYFQPKLFYISLFYFIDIALTNLSQKQEDNTS